MTRWLDGPRRFALLATVYIFRPHAQSVKMQPLATEIARFVCVCLLGTTVSRVETAEPIDMLFRPWTLMGSTNHVLSGGPDPLE